MRVPSDLPQRLPQVQRGRLGLVVVVSVLTVVLLSLRGTAVFYTDYLWFEEVGFANVWQGVLGAKVALAILFTAFFFGVIWVNLTIADRLAPPFRPAGPEEELIERYRQVVGGRTGQVRMVTAAILALIAGLGTSAQWDSWILFTHRQEFGTTDPQFGQDIGFFVFSLPFVSFLINWLFASFIIILIVTAVAHYLNGGIRFQVPAGQRVSAQVKAHLSVLFGVLALLKAAQYWLQRYELSFSNRGVVSGAGYTDVNAQLPALQLLVIISIAAAVLFLVNIRLQGWILPVIAVGLWAFTSVVVGAAYPAFIQKFRVQPNESVREQPYIERNIQATRKAMGLENVTVRDFEYDEDLTAQDLAENSATIRNVRLWDPKFLQRTYQRLQEIRGFFRFNGVDVDRYDIEGDITQTMLSARELNPGGLPSQRQSWVNRTLQFTHGYGAVLSPANAVTSEGQPDFLVKDVPPKGTPEIKEPRIYYGENLPGYVIVNTQQKEIDFTKPDGTDQTSSYSGDGGVAMGSLPRRVAFALRFGDVNPLISNFVRSDSKAVYFRDIAERARKAAPFLYYDADPYPVVIEGRIQWIQDAYTLTNRYPYAEPANADRVPSESGLHGSSFNYIRNSVKVVVDAYNGDMTFYAIDENDPIIRAYQEAFPSLFTPGERMSDDLRNHLRYPEDLFRVQTTAYGVYHITDPADFYSKSDAWDISQDPGSEVISGNATTSTVAPVAGQQSTMRERRMDPYYLLMRLPDTEQEEFLILQPFVPTSRDDARKELSAFMIAKSDPEGYGQLESFVMPRGQQVDGPAIVGARIQQEPTISEEITLLSRAGSQVLLGNLLVIPVDQSLLYIRPLYVQAEETQVPEFKKAIVVYSDQVVMRDTLQEALKAIFGDAPATQEAPPGTPPVPAPPPSAPPAGEGGEVQDLIDQALGAFARAETALKNGDLAAYQRELGEARRLLEEAQAGSAPPTTTTVQPSAAA